MLIGDVNICNCCFPVFQFLQSSVPVGSPVPVELRLALTLIITLIWEFPKLLQSSAQAPANPTTPNPPGKVYFTVSIYPSMLSAEATAELV